MSHDKAIARKQVERLDGVTKAWFEWIHEKGELSKILVVEVSFDTDPNSLHFRQSVIDGIVDTAKAGLEEIRQWLLAASGSCLRPKDNPRRCR